MDAVEKAAEALREAGWRRWVSSPTGAGADRVHRETRERIARIVLAAVGYPHQSSDEGTCWCPVAEQAGRERDALKDERDQLRLERDGLLERREAADRLHDKTMRGWANTCAERDRYKAALDQVADAFNARDAVTETDAEMYATDPGGALSRAVTSILDDLTTMMEAAHCEARRAVTAEAERDRMEVERARYRMALEEIADPRCGIFTAGDGKPGIDAGAESRIARAALDAEETP